MPRRNTEDISRRVLSALGVTSTVAGRSRRLTRGGRWPVWRLGFVEPVRTPGRVTDHDERRDTGRRRRRQGAPLCCFTVLFSPDRACLLVGSRVELTQRDDDDGSIASVAASSGSAHTVYGHGRVACSSGTDSFLLFFFFFVVVINDVLVIRGCRCSGSTVRGERFRRRVFSRSARERRWREQRRNTRIETKQPPRDEQWKRERERKRYTTRTHTHHRQQRTKQPRETKERRGRASERASKQPSDKKLSGTHGARR